MRTVCSLALLCLFLQHNTQAKHVAANMHTLEESKNDSTLPERLMTKIANKKSFYTFEVGITTGPAFKPNNYVAFEYTRKTTNVLQAGLFLSYSAYQFQDEVNYHTQLTELSSWFDSSNEEEISSKNQVIDYHVNRLTLAEIGLSAKYALGSRTTLRLIGTFAISQSVSGYYTDNDYDSTYKMVDGKRAPSIINNNPSSGTFVGTSSGKNTSFENYFFLHAGIDYRITERTRITTKVGIPMRDALPGQIGYRAATDNVSLARSSTEFPTRPAFVKVGLSVTL